jgi:signal transduction histidine kinase
MTMESQIAETLLASPGDMARLHRRVVRVGAAAGWFCAVLFILVGLFTGDTSYFLEAVGPILAALLMTSQVLIHRENAGVALLGAATIVVVTFLLIGDETTLLAASLAVVIIASIGMLFIQSRHLLLTLGFSLVMFAVPLLWGVPATQAISLGSIMAVSFGLTSAIFYAVRNAATTLNRRFQVLFEHSPTAVLELDWTDSLNYTRSEFSGRPERIRGFLGAYPDVVRKAASLVRVVRANQAALDLLQAKDAALVLGAMDGDMIPQEWVDGYTEVLISLFRGERFLDFEFRAITFDGGSKWLNARCVNVASAGEADGVLVALADTTHLKAKEDAMHELIRSKDEFVASISHELRTPLTAVVGLTSEMIDGDLGGAEREELIELVASQAQEMSYIIDDLLVAARAEMGTVAVALGEVDLGKELAAAVGGVGIQLDPLPNDLPIAIGDGPRIRQILRNLLTNLERYGGSNRRVVGGTGRGRVWLEIRDDGSGVPDEDASRIFEPYASAHTGVSTSVGLGLSVARRLAELMGGSLSYSRDGEESVFRLELGSAEESLFV